MPLLSILIPGVPSRFLSGSELVKKLYLQSTELPNRKCVEIIWLVDNWSRTLGAKRQKMVEMAKGKFITFIDDDDTVTDDFLSTVIPNLELDIDVLTFNEDSTWNNQKTIIEYKMDNPYELLQEGGVTRRPPVHVSIWRIGVALKCDFPDTNWGEDRPWGEQACKFVKNSLHIDRVLRIYKHSEKTSEALAASKGQR